VAADLAIRNATYRLLAELGRAPTIDEVAAARGQGSAEVTT
jgi:DNA-directed RNA polymerase specialized sigma subunit